MEYLGGGAVLSGGNVPAFLAKLWILVEDPDTDPLICWSPVHTHMNSSPSLSESLRLTLSRQIASVNFDQTPRG